MKLTSRVNRMNILCAELTAQQNKLLHFENNAWYYNRLHAAYFAETISYGCKMFMKFTTGVNFINILHT